MMLNRSTKGASKLRRELINVEINSIRDLLPLPDGVRKRLSQLQVMAICKAFIGKSNFFTSPKNPEFRCSPSEEIRTDFDFLQTLPGFLLLASADGRFLYLSDNIMEILGHSMVDFVTQSESAFDLFDDKGQTILTELLSGVHDNSDANLPSNSSSGDFLTDEVTFTCLMGLAKNARRHPGLDRLKAMKVKARLLKSTSYLADSTPVLAAFCLPCSPVFPAGGERPPAFNTMICQSRHSADMKFVNVDSNLEWHLGYSVSELQRRSWYDFLHPDHESEFATKHLELISTENNFVSSIFVRLQTKYGHFIWLHLLMRANQIGDGGIARQSEVACVGHVLDEEQVSFMKEREQVEAEASYFMSNDAFESPNEALFPFSMDEGMMVAPEHYLTSAAAVWTNGEEMERPLKRKAAGGVVGTKPRKVQHLQMYEDSISTTSADSSSYSSTVYLDFDHFGKLEAFPAGAAFPDVYQKDFELKSEERFLPKALSPYSVLSESLPSNSPRTFSEDENSFFSAIPSSSKNLSSGLSDDSLPLVSSFDDLTDIKDLDADSLILLPSPTQEVPRELPELDVTDLYAYLKTVEDGKKQEAGGQTFCTPSYAEYVWQQRANRQNGYKYQTVQRPDFYFESSDQQRSSSSGRMTSESTSDFSGSAFLERLIDSPQFTELIGLMSGGGGGSQRRAGLLEQGILPPSYGC